MTANLESIETALRRLKHRPYYCDVAQVQLILELTDIRQSNWNERYLVGHPGSDGIEFQIELDQNSAGIFAYYPNTNEDGIVAKDFDELIQKWMDDDIVYPF